MTRRSGVSAHEKVERLRNIERLVAYRDRGVFPRKSGKGGERMPYFIEVRAAPAPLQRS